MGLDRRIPLQLPFPAMPSHEERFFAHKVLWTQNDDANRYSFPMSTTVTSGVERWANDSMAEARASDDADPACQGDLPPGERKIELGYVPFGKQSEFHASPAKYRLFGGAAGPGKSKALLMEAILQAHEHAGANTLLAAPHISGTRAVAAALFPPRRSARTLQKLPGIEAPGDLVERLDHALRLLPERERRLPISGRGISFHRHRRADACSRCGSGNF